MDPDANLAEQLRIAARIQAEQDAVPDDTAPTTDQLTEWTTDAARLAELVQALDQWILGGGFLPAAWQRASASNLRHEPHQPRPFTAADNGKRVSVRGQWGVLEYPITDPPTTAPNPAEAIVWYDEPNARGWNWEYVLPIDVTDRKP